MDGYRIKLNRRVEVALSSLSEQERERVEASLFRLTQGPNPGGVPQVYRVRGPGRELHVLRATDRLRILFRVGKDRSILVEDIVNHDLVTRYFRQAV